MYRNGKIKNKPNNCHLLTRTGTFELKPGHNIDLVFRFLTKREVNLQPGNDSSVLFIRPRKIRINILINGQHSSQQPYDLNIVPTMAPIDHTFRFYEPEQSHYQVRLPPFVHLNSQLEYDLSN